MKLTQIDIAEGVLIIAIVLLMVGVIHFTPVAVGLLVLGTMFKLPVRL
jgi:hypothetical protein